MGANLSSVPDEPTNGFPSAVELLAELDRLRARIEALEAERDEYAQENAELFLLQQVFSTMNSMLEIDDILSMLLRGVVEALKFDRVILFDVRNDGTIVRRLECTVGHGVVDAKNPHDYRRNSTLNEIAEGNLQLAYGSADDEDRPLDDTRCSYCVAPLIARDVIRGLLYADDPPGCEIGERQLRILLDFAAQAAIAVENARLYVETRRLLEETQSLANTDSLTGIANRRGLNDLLEHELNVSSRYNTQFAFAILDLDDLKKINDYRGHEVGDQALRHFAHVLKQNARKGDILARYAGDEFVLVMSQTERSTAARGLERILAALRRNGLTASVGVAMYPVDGRDTASLFYAADRALYAAKEHGKNRCEFYASESDGAVETPPID